MPNDGSTDLPAWVGPDPKLHEAYEFLRKTKPILIEKGLWVVAEGGSPAKCNSIVDFDVNQLPVPPSTSSSYYRYLETKLRLDTQNEQNDRTRTRYLLEAWDELFGLISRCVAKSSDEPLLRALETQCIRHDLPGGARYDAPRAWSILTQSLFPEEREREDKDFYRAAEKLQRDNLSRFFANESLLTPVN